MALAKKGYQDDLVDPVIEHLIRRKLLSDNRLLESLVARYTGKRPMGIEKFRAEMLSRGAPEESIEACLREHWPENESARALEALSAKFSPSDDRGRGARYLVGRGFDENVVEAAIHAFFRVD
jgi:SOS response regulatory protein OraA/RecX